MNYMGVTRGTRKRETNVPSVLLQARISPDLKDEVQAAAAASGVSTAFYLEALLRAQVDSGGLPTIGRPRIHTELELPVTAA